MEDKPCTATDADQLIRFVEEKNFKKTCTGGGKYCCFPQYLNNGLCKSQVFILFCSRHFSAKYWIGGIRLPT